MSLADLTSASAVERALEEFDELGRDPFLAKYGFQPARAYFLIKDGRRYDSKAIVGAAHGYQFPDRGPLTSSGFSGGEATVRRKLEALGFSVQRDPAIGESERWDTDARETLEERIARIRAEHVFKWPERLEVRRKAEAEARRLLDEAAGTMSKSKFRLSANFSIETSAVDPFRIASFLGSPECTSAPFKPTLIASTSL